MPTFDIVSKVNLQEVDNALNQALKEIRNRYDFRGQKAEIERKEKELVLAAEDEFKLKAMTDVIHGKLVKRGIDLRSLDSQKIEDASGGTVKQIIKIRDGLDKEDAKKITKEIKDLRLKVQAQIQEDMVRISGKKIDDLQSVIQHFKGDSKMDLPLQFVNMRS